MLHVEIHVDLIEESVTKKRDELLFDVQYKIQLLIADVDNNEKEQLCYIWQNTSSNNQPSSSIYFKYPPPIKKNHNDNHVYSKSIVRSHLCWMLRDSIVWLFGIATCQ